MSNTKKLTEGEGEGGEGGGGKTFSIVITSSRCKLFCNVLVWELILYRELYFRYWHHVGMEYESDSHLILIHL